MDAAVAVGHDLLTADPSLGSVRVIHQLDALRAQLATHRDYSPVRAFLVRFDDARRARMVLLADLVPSSSKGATS
jgi:hypothetical protein